MKKLLCLALTLIPALANAFTITPETIQFNTGLWREIEDENIPRLKEAASGSSVSVYINSGGGDTLYAYEIIGAMRSLSTACVADKAYSAAFSIFQACNLRVVKKESQLMTHQHTFYPDGKPMFVATLYQLGLMAMERQMFFIMNDSMRMKISAELYMLNIEKGDWNMPGSGAIIGNRAADREEPIVCADSTKDKMLTYRFMEAKAEISMCPVNRKYKFFGPGNQVKLLRKVLFVEDLKKK